MYIDLAQHTRSKAVRVLDHPINPDLCLSVELLPSGFVKSATLLRYSAENDAWCAEEAISEPEKLAFTALEFGVLCLAPQYDH
ncbi:hypothetical protein [Parvibaculum sp.]|uniref:hypothetical protein n=1 Tax=Parvibaculum sp. TaxID=2024848 RepID=UPI003210C0C0